MSNRIPAAALVLSASALIVLVLHEGYSDRPIIPVAGDVLTIGFGTTEGVKAEDKTTPVRALVRLGADVGKYEARLRACLGPVPMFQHEWDAAVQLAYNIGVTAFCNSTAARKFRAGDYEGACNAFAMWNKAGGKVLPGLVNRRERERQLCLGQRPSP